MDNSGKVTIVAVGTAIITATKAADDDYNEAMAAYTLTIADTGAFITTWQISPGSVANRTITIPIHADSSYRYTVNWGDDSTDTTVYTAAATHIYSTPATTTSYKVAITGEFPRIYFNNGEDSNKIISIDQWGNNRWDSMENAFRGCSNLSNYTAIDTPDLSQVTDMSHMFQGAALFNGDIGDWDVSNVADMSNMFANAALFNGNIGDWEDKVGQVTDMSFMFQSASAFNQNISQWEVGEVTDMSRMFQSASVFNGDIDGWDVRNVTDMNNMFNSASLFNGNIASWDVDKVTNMRFMFSDAREFNQDIGGWDVGEVTDMSFMFESALAFNQNIGGWDDVSNVTDMNSMFSGASAFNQNISGWDVGEVTDMNNMFSDASKFNQNIGGWDVGEVIDMVEMFFDASQFDQNIGGWDVSKVTDMFDMFEGATLSIDNYDALLAGWSMLTLTPGIEFNAGNSQYCNQPAQGMCLTDPSSNFWDIDDDGLVH